MRWACLVFACCALSGCGDKKKSASYRTAEKTSLADQAPANGQALDTITSNQAATQVSAAEAANSSTDTEERKIIFTAEVDLATDDFSRTEEGIPTLIKEHGGYISEGAVQHISGDRRTGRWVARIPVDRFDAFVDSLSSFGVPEQRRQKAQEVTEEYVDLKARIATTHHLEERILKLLEQRNGSLEETIRLEHELARIRGEAERMEGRLRYLADRTALATVTITAREVQDYTPPEAPDFAQRLDDGFSHSMTSMVQTGQDLAVGGARAAPWFLATSIFLIPAAVIARRRWRAARGAKT